MIWTIIFNPYIDILLIISFVSVIYFIYSKTKILTRNKIYEKDIYNDINSLNRDIDVKYNPSIVGILVDNIIGIRELLADIMNLYAKKVIEVEKKENHYSLKLANESIDNISESDSYIIKTLITHESNFQFKTWKELVMLQYEQLDFINNKTEIKKKDKTAEIIILYFIIMIIGTISLPIITKDFRTGLLFLIIYISIMGVVVFPAATMMKDLIKKKKRKELSELGKQELRKWMKFKVFIKEYTLVGEKNIEDVVLYEKYIPYALVVGIGKDYTGTIYKIFEKEDFKKLIEDLKNQFVDENFTAY